MQNKIQVFIKLLRPPYARPEFYLGAAGSEQEYGESQLSNHIEAVTVSPYDQMMYKPQSPFKTLQELTFKV